MTYKKHQNKKRKILKEGLRDMCQVVSTFDVVNDLNMESLDKAGVTYKLMDRMTEEEYENQEDDIDSDEEEIIEPDDINDEELISKFNDFSEDIYRDSDLIDISNKMIRIYNMVEKSLLDKEDDWFDVMTIKRDLKSIAEGTKILEKTAKDISVLQQRLESIYEDIGVKLARYFEIK